MRICIKLFATFIFNCEIPLSYAMRKWQTCVSLNNLNEFCHLGLTTEVLFIIVECCCDFREGISATNTKFERIVEFDKERLKPKCDVLRKLIVKAKAMEKEVFIIGITGASRSGKSFFLNLLQIYLEHYYKVNASFVSKAL